MNHHRLTIVNAIQLFIGVISNLFLLLNMGRRIRFSVAQPITITGWCYTWTTSNLAMMLIKPNRYVSAICRTALSATAAGPLLKGLDFPQNEAVWSESFYYGVWAAILYFLDASLLAATFWGASSGHYEKKFRLNKSQRTLMLQTIMFLLHLTVGARIFAAIEHWDFLDAVYWADVTLFTIGFGDFAPSTTLGRALLIPYALIGIVTLGLVVQSIVNLFIERGKYHIIAKVEENKRRRVIRNLIRRGRENILEPIQRDSTIIHTHSVNAPTNEYERRRAEFALMREIQHKSSSRQKWIGMTVSTSAWLILWLVGAAVFYRTEKTYQNWTYFEAVYFCFEAWTTIGYGDLTPISNAGRSFFVFWSLLALPTMTVLISHAGSTVIKAIRNGTIRLGYVTILPSDEGYLYHIKHIISRITFGKVFSDFQDSANTIQAEHLTGTKHRVTSVAPDSHEISLIGDRRGRPGRSVVDQPASQTRRQLCYLREPHEELPKGNDLNLLLVCELEEMDTQRKDLKAHHYSFDQWAWYLKLMGRDESNPCMHCNVQTEGTRPSVNNSVSGKDLRWSWVGKGSPLMSHEEESEWILHGLLCKLRESLSAETERQLRTGGRMVDGEEEPVV